MHQQLLAFYGEDIVDIVDSGGNVDLNDQQRSGRLVTATHYVNRKSL